MDSKYWWNPTGDSFLERKWKKYPIIVISNTQQIPTIKNLWGFADSGYVICEKTQGNQRLLAK